MGSYFLQRSHLCLSEALSCKWLAVGKSMLKRQFRCVPHLSLYFLLSSTVSYCWRLNRGPKGLCLILHCETAQLVIEIQRMGVRSPGEGLLVMAMLKAQIETYSTDCSMYRRSQKA